MKYSFIILSIFIYNAASAQNYTLPDGEYMDTLSNINYTCKDYNEYYYQVGGKYPKSSFTLLKEVKLFCQTDNAVYTGSGYITFRFKIDWEGKLMEGIQVLQTDEQYKSWHFDKKLVNELFAFLKTLDKWRIAKTTGGETFLYRAFITFRIKDGKVINIIP